jgi:hypothetical protein
MRKESLVPMECPAGGMRTWWITRLLVILPGRPNRPQEVLMHRTISVHPTSLALGLVFAGVCFISMSQVWPAGQHIIVEYGPSPRDMVQIREGTPFTVPPGKLLVMTALGNSDAAGIGSILRVNGTVELTNTFVYAQNPPSVCPIANGLALPAGSVVEAMNIGGGTANGRAWGYLAPQ